MILIDSHDKESLDIIQIKIDIKSFKLSRNAYVTHRNIAKNDVFSIVTYAMKSQLSIKKLRIKPLYTLYIILIR